MFSQKHNPGPKTHKLRQSRKGSTLTDIVIEKKIPRHAPKLRIPSAPEATTSLSHYVGTIFSYVGKVTETVSLPTYEKWYQGEILKNVQHY